MYQREYWLKLLTLSYFKRERLKAKKKEKKVATRTLKHVIAVEKQSI
jgi:hypothetical protein